MLVPRERAIGSARRGITSTLRLISLRSQIQTYVKGALQCDASSARPQSRSSYPSFSALPRPHPSPRRRIHLADTSQHVNYRRVTSSELSSRTTPPTRVKMLVRDFIDDSLYNPSYGYFSRNATIFTPPDEGYDFGGFRDAAAFQEAVAGRYEEFEAREVALEEAQAAAGEESATKGKGKGKGKEARGRATGGLGRQVWHTPTELFKVGCDLSCFHSRCAHCPLLSLLAALASCPRLVSVSDGDTRSRSFLYGKPELG